MISGVATVKSRPYQSSIRRGDAPRLVCAAATRLFSTKGYLATSIEDIAREAGVARPTVFTAVGTKPVILKTVFDQAIAGDDAPVAVADRSWWHEALTEPDPRRSIELHVRNTAQITGRTGLLVRVVETAAAVDDDARRVLETWQRQRRQGMAEFVDALARKTDLRVDKDTARDTLWALSPDAYVRLVHDGGWEVERFRAWATDLLQRLLLP